MENTSYILSIEAPDGYIPEKVELAGYGKIYTSSPYSENRSWDLPSSAISYINKSQTIQWNAIITEKRGDVMRYRDRGNTLIEGKMLYRDVPTLTPPLINLFWIIPAILGGGFFVFRAYFAVFVLLVTIVVMRIHRAKKEKYTLLPPLFILLNPLTIHSVIFAVQDDIIVMLLFSISLFFLFEKKITMGAICIGLGAACKIWPLLLTPGILTNNDKSLKKIAYIVLSISIAGITLLPFFILARDNVIEFMKLYLTGGTTLQGISLWRYLGEIGFNLVYMLPVMIICSLTLLYLVIKKKTPIIVTGALFILLFLMIYPKIHAGYYLPLLLFVPFFWNNRSIVSLSIGISLGVIGLDIYNLLYSTNGLNLIIPISISLSLLYLLLLFFLKIFELQPTLCTKD
jgi:hypothetical protein